MPQRRKELRSSDMGGSIFEEITILDDPTGWGSWIGVVIGFVALILFARHYRNKKDKK